MSGRGIRQDRSGETVRVRSTCSECGCSDGKRLVIGINRPAHPEWCGGKVQTFEHGFVGYETCPCTNPLLRRDA